MVNHRLDLEYMPPASQFSAEIPRLDEGKPVKRKDILNLLNYVNFQEGKIFAQFKHRTYDHSLSIPAEPKPCTDENLECSWIRGGSSAEKLKNYAFDSFLVTNGQHLFRVKAELVRMDELGLQFRIPDFGHEKSIRKIKRHECEGVAVRILQNGILLHGALLDYSAVSCRIELDDASENALCWLNPTVPVVLSMERGGILLFSGECAITRSEVENAGRTLVLAPGIHNIRRYPPREYRSQRHFLSPAPNINILHPLTGERQYLQAVDLSSSGFATEEFYHSSTLLPGLIIPEISLEIGNHFMMKCQAQVLYRNIVLSENGETLVRCGIVFLDLSIQDQATLSSLLHQDTNNRIRVCGRVDMDALWSFFFESGFIYPSKYLSMEAHKKDFKRTYEKLYLQSPSITRHFIFQDRGALFGHMSMIRSSARTWLIHHHAASRSGYGMAGVAVLDQVGQYINEFHLHRSTRMDFVMCYYRKENRFPSRVFGGVARDIGNPKGSSIDAFAYTSLSALPAASSESIQVFPASAEDRSELERFYGQASGGLCLDALNLIPGGPPEDPLTAEYQRLGFKRERQVFALKKDGALIAAILVSITELGLNLSNLTDCVHVFVVDRGKLTPSMLSGALNGLGSHFGNRDSPILVYPVDFLDHYEIPYEKQYILWVFNMNFLDGYFKSLRNTFKRDAHGRLDKRDDDN